MWPKCPGLSLTNTYLCNWKHPHRVVARHHNIREFTYRLFVARVPNVWCGQNISKDRERFKSSPYNYVIIILYRIKFSICVLIKKKLLCFENTYESRHSWVTNLPFTGHSLNSMYPKWLAVISTITSMLWPEEYVLKLIFFMQD